MKITPILIFMVLISACSGTGKLKVEAAVEKGFDRFCKMDPIPLAVIKANLKKTRPGAVNWDKLCP